MFYSRRCIRAYPYPRHSLAYKKQLIWRWQSFPFFSPGGNFYGEISSDVWLESLLTYTPLSIIRRRLEQNSITEIPPKAFSPYRKLQRMWVTFAINTILSFFFNRQLTTFLISDIFFVPGYSSTAISATTKLEKWRPTRSTAWNPSNRCAYEV